MNVSACVGDPPAPVDTNEIYDFVAGGAKLFEESMITYECAADSAINAVIMCNGTGVWPAAPDLSCRKYN